MKMTGYSAPQILAILRPLSLNTPCSIRLALPTRSKRYQHCHRPDARRLCGAEGSSAVLHCSLTKYLPLNAVPRKRIDFAIDDAPATPHIS